MNPMLCSPERIVIFAIDGLAGDVFHHSMQAGDLPNISRLFAGESTAAVMHLNAVSTAPSITFCSHTSIFTGLQPKQHGILGNQFFDRFGMHFGGVPRFYAFDLGGTYEIDDALNVFLGKGLINKLLPKDRQTIYEAAGKAGLSSLVAYNMLSRGASTWLKPSVTDVARLTRSKGVGKLSAEAFDRKMVNRVLHYLKKKDCPGVTTLYFLGLDHESHHHGRFIQAGYLRDVIDPQIGRFLNRLDEQGALNHLLAVFISDHGQVDVIEDDRHSLRLSFPFDREMAYLFDALDLDVHDYPGEDPNCDAVAACNGGMAYVYLRHRAGTWNEAARFSEDILPVAQALWETNLNGRYSPDMQGSLAAVLIRNTESEGWYSPYSVYTPDQLQPLDHFLFNHPQINQLEGVSRLADLTGPLSGDLLLLANYPEHFYFGSPVKATHGGIHPEESLCVFSIAMLEEGLDCQEGLENKVEEILDRRLDQEERGYISVADVFPVLGGIMGWADSTL